MKEKGGREVWENKKERRGKKEMKKMIKEGKTEVKYFRTSAEMGTQTIKQGNKQK